MLYIGLSMKRPSYLSQMQPAKAQTSLHIRTVLPGA